jgi:hypothetical protein
MGLWFSMAAMAVDASLVIPLRLAKIAAGGGAGTREANGMVTEKLMAANRAAVMLATGGKPEAVLRHYGRKVRANRKRLAKQRPRT